MERIRGDGGILDFDVMGVVEPCEGSWVGVVGGEFYVGQGEAVDVARVKSGGGEGFAEHGDFGVGVFFFGERGRLGGGI